MPSIRKINSKKGLRYQSRVRIKGFPEQVKTFNTLKEARSWSILIETNLYRTGSTISLNTQAVLFKDLSEQYSVEVLHQHKGFKQERSHLNVIRSHLDDYSIGNLSSSVLGSYRDQRLKLVSGSSVKKELSLIGRIINFAIRECGYHFPNGNPINLISHPKVNKPRKRRLENGELSKLTEFADDFMSPIINILIETGMRRGELCKIRNNDIDCTSQTLILRDTKNATDRKIPLTNKAIRSLKKLIEGNSKCISSNTPIIFYHQDSLTHKFIKICKSADIQNLRLHDLRHEATSRFFEKGLNQIEVASITGHKDLAMLQRYTHLKAEDLLLRIQ